MCDEIAKATKRRMRNLKVYDIYFSGVGIDIGCGHSAMQPYPSTERIDPHDSMFGHSDANILPDKADNSYDFVVSSHCLEHMTTPITALRNWIRITKPLGYLVITVPDWEMYERKQWPSKFNGDHKYSWTLDSQNLPSHVINVSDFLIDFERVNLISVLSVHRITADFNPNLDISIDQTAGPAECAIEFILRKREA